MVVTSHSASNLVPADIARAIVDPQAYANWDGLHVMLARLRREHPFALGDLEGYDRFWIASKYEDIQLISKNPQLFASGIPNLQSKRDIELRQTVAPFRSIVNMNPPEHLKYRVLTQAWFAPKNLRALEERLRTLARHYVARLIEAGGECEFVSTVGVHYPLLVIMSILGVPPEDEELMLRITQDMLGGEDSAFRGDGPKTPEERAKLRKSILEEAWRYFERLSESRRLHPTDDVATTIATGRVDGELLNSPDMLAYYVTLALAGHDTTSSTTAGLIWLLAERPDLLAQVKGDISLIPHMVDEGVRWVSPVFQFTRTANLDTVVRGQTIRAGDRIILSFPSGNRDEDVFEAPFEFRLDRPPGAHVGFGYGAHMCLGIHLAKLEMKILFEELLPRLDSLELAGKPARFVSSFVGGPKKVPIRYRIK